MDSKLKKACTDIFCGHDCLEKYEQLKGTDHDLTQNKFALWMAKQHKELLENMIGQTLDKEQMEALGENIRKKMDSAKKVGRNVQPDLTNGNDTENQENQTFSGKSNKPAKDGTARGGRREDSGRKPKYTYSVFNETNENIDWAKWSWNPVTGCLHNCSYCYARDIANRFYKGGFRPSFHRHRLTAPFNTRIPPERKREPGMNNVFVCSMADLFGDWVEPKWIAEVLNVVQKTSQWTYIFLTKNPKRYTQIDWPDNAWVGATVDSQERVEPTEKAFKEFEAKVKFVSCEPFREEISFSNINVFDWIILGGQSKTSGMPAGQPKKTWVTSLLLQAWENGLPTFCKPNLKAGIKDYP